MEFMLNKIDQEIRQKINTEAKEGKVHSTKRISVKKDKEEKDKNDNRDRRYKLARYNNDKKIIVNAVKFKDIEVDAFKEEIKENGTFLDVKR